VLGVAIGRTSLYWLLNGAFLAATLVSPLFVLLFPVLVIALVLVWLRLCFVAQAAALCEVGPGAGPEAGPGRGRGPFGVSFRLSGRQPGRLLGRLLLLAFVAVNLILAAGFVGAPFTALAGAEAGPAFKPGTQTLALNDFLGPNVAIFMLGSVFSALGLGASHVLSSVGTTLLYRNLEGPVDEAGFAPVTDDVAS
jgi:hypothetical protein